MYKVVSLFSGAGGLDLGFKLADKFEIIFANEIKVSRATTYSNNFSLKLFSCENNITEAQKGYIYACDVSNIDFSSMKDLGINIIVGGPPCQDFSVIRGPDSERKGIYGRGGKLYSHFIRALVQIQPEVFVFENVPGLKSANNGNAYNIIINDFKKLNIRWQDVKRLLGYNNNSKDIIGYHLLYSDIVDFANLGVPQSRRRLIIIGIRKDLIKNVKLLNKIRFMLSNQLKGLPWKFRKYPLTPIEIFEGDTLDKLNDIYKKIMLKWKNVWKDVNTKKAHTWKSQIWDELSFDIMKDYLNINGLNNIDESELEESLKQHELLLRELGYYHKPIYKLVVDDSTTDMPRVTRRVLERLKRIPPGENYKFVMGTKWSVEGKGISLIYRRLHPLKPSYTIPAYGGGGTYVYHYDRDRYALTLREQARLQTFPDDFLFYGNKLEKRAQIGEAVPPLAGKRIAQAILMILDYLNL